MPKTGIYFFLLSPEKVLSRNSVVQKLLTAVGRQRQGQTNAFRNLMPIEISRNRVPKGTCRCGSDFWLGCIQCYWEEPWMGWGQPACFGFHFHSHVGPTHCFNSASQPLDHHQRWVCRQLVLCDSRVELSIDSSPQQRLLSSSVLSFLILIPASATDASVHDVCCFSLFNLKR